MKKFFLVFCMLGIAVYANESKPAAECFLKDMKENVISWEAYKTPLKIGVGGTFTEVVFSGTHKDTKVLATFLKGATLAINVLSVDSGNKGRDTKLVKDFFGKMKGSELLVMVKEVQDNIIVTEITMNGITNTVPLKYQYQNGILEANGVIDLFDFQAQNALQSLTKACYSLHKGKTWSDVHIGFKGKMIQVCP